MWYFSDKKLEAAYNYALIAHWTWEELRTFAYNEMFELAELADALAYEIDAEGYDQNLDCETDYPWCCPWEGTRAHPKAIEHAGERVKVEQRGKKLTIYLPEGVYVKMEGSNGTIIRRNEQ